MTKFPKYCVDTLKRGGIGVLPTDTIYGLVGKALSRKAVLRIYKARKRSPAKPMIILIGSLNDLTAFNVRPNERVLGVLRKIWPGPVSVIFPCPEKKYSYLHRGTNTLAFRLPKDVSLRKLLAVTGPLVAPSANLEGRKPALSVAAAENYFNDEVDFYLDAGERRSLPSTLIEIKR
jgi:L-threonylcarbamoyladenylate synthase